MHYLIQENIFNEVHYDKLMDIMTRGKFDHQVIKLIPFVDEVEWQEMDTKNIICFGAVKLAHLAKKYDWYPGSFMNEKHDYRVYSKEYGLENMLNGDSKICRFADEIEFTDIEMFFRPCEDTKTFTGKVFDKYDWKDFVENSLTNGHTTKLTADTAIQVSRVKRIQQEIRTWIVKGKVVTASFYKLGNSVWYKECFEEDILNFAQKMADKYQPAEAFVLDVAVVEGAYKIVEINCLNCAGFYKNDISKLIMSLDEAFNLTEND